MTDQHDPGQLAAYAIGLLGSADARALEAHLAQCPRCRQELTELREVDGALRRVPPELLLDEPSPGGELVLQRTLRQIRGGGRGGRRRWRLAIAAAAVIVAAVAALVGAGVAGVVLGRSAAHETITTAPPAEPGSRVLTGANPTTGARMTVTVTPAAGWVRLKATVMGVPAGERCMLVVIDRNRDHYVAASWLVSPGNEKGGTTVDGAAVVALGDVAAIAVQNFEPRELVIASA